MTFLLAKQWFVGNISLQVRHRKCLILLGHSSFQINFHRFVILDAYEQFSQAFVPFFSFSMLSATLYALFTINSLLIVRAHILELSGRLRLISILRTTSASCGRKVFLTFLQSQVPLSRSKRPTTLSPSIRLDSWIDYTEGLGGWKPSIPPNVHISAITYTPSHTSFQDASSFQ